MRVPNERDDASTTKVEVQFPDGFASASYEPVPGWTVKVARGSSPRRSRPTTARSPKASTRSPGPPTASDDAIPPGAFQDFGLSVQIPGKAGDKLTFKALQTYSGGEVVRWIGAEDSDNPAPIVTVTAARRPSTAPRPAPTTRPAAAPRAAPRRPRTTTATASRSSR